jgi:hypothetical protein
MQTYPMIGPFLDQPAINIYPLVVERVWSEIDRNPHLHAKISRQR